MTLEEIFKTNPKLLEEPEVKELIKYITEQHKITAEKFNSKYIRTSNIMDLCMYSEALLIDGKDAKETILKIMDII